MAFIVLEGIDGSGTTTQIHRVAAALRADGRRVHTTREPSNGPIGKLVREILSGRVCAESAQSAEMMALLFAADRIDHNVAEIERGVASGQIVISDRYDLSSLAYQSVAGKSAAANEERVAWIRSLNRTARRPDLTIVLDVDPAVAEARRRTRGNPDELYEIRELQERLCHAYLAAESLVPGDEVRHVDGNRSVEDITEAILVAIGPLIQGVPC